MRRLITGVLVLVGVLAFLPSPAEAAIQTFKAITANDVAAVATGEAQLYVDITDPGAGQMLFTFFNSGPLASSITDVYFDDGSLLGIASIDNSDPGVSFTQLATPSNLPGGSAIDPPFVTTAGFSADSDPPPTSNGVNPGESVGILFDLQPGKTADDVWDDLSLMALRIGIHVQGFEGGASESFVNNGVEEEEEDDVIPEPASLLVWGLLATAFAATVWRRRRN